MSFCSAILTMFLLAGPPQEPSIESLVKLLHSEILEQRERGSAELLKLGSKALSALKVVASGSDAEAASRARALMLRIRIQRLSRPVVAAVDNPFAPFGRADHFQTTPDGKIAMGCDLENVYAWTLPEGRLIRTWKGHPKHVAEAALSSDGSRLLTLGNLNLNVEVVLWEFPSGRRIGSYGSDPIMKFKQGPVCFHPDGRRAFSVFEGRNHSADFAIWETDSGKILRRFGSCEGFMRGSAVSRDGRMVAVSGRDGYLSVWEVETGKRVWGAASGWMVNCLEFTPEGASLILAGEDGRIERRAALTGAVEATVEERGPRVLYTSLNPQGTYLATSGDSGPLVIYDIKKGRRMLQVESAGWPVDFVGETKAMTGFVTVSVTTGTILRHPPRVSVNAACIDDTRTRMAVASHHTKRVAVADVESGKLIWGVTSPFLPERVVLGVKGSRAVILRQSDHGIAAAGYAVGSSESPEWQSEGWISGFDGARGLLFRLKGDGMHVYDMNADQDREVLKGTVDGPIRIPSGSPYAYGMKNNIARQLDLATLREIQEMPDVKELEALDADPSGDLLLEGWNLISPATGRVLARIEADLGFLSSESRVARTFFGRDGERILALTANGLVVTLAASE